MYRLHVVPAQGQPFDHVLEGDALIIGRSSSSDLVIADRFLSRRHTRLYKDGHTWYVEDLGSRNGTLLNGDLAKEPQPVKAGDVIKLSGSMISIYEADAPRVAPLAASADGKTLFRPASDFLEKEKPSDTTTVPGAESLRRYADRLRLLNEVHDALSRSISLDDLLELILERVFDHLRPEQGVIFLRNPDGDVYRAASRSATGTSDDYLYSRSLIREVTEKGLAALVLDAQTDERFAEARSILSSGVRSMVAAPLLDPEGTLGMIVLNSKAAVRQFAEEDMDLLVSLASVAAMRIRNVALAEEAAERRRLEEELALARRIQEALLPKALPNVSGYEVFGTNFPSRGVSGDYYEIQQRKDNTECILMVADVSGKGIAASLLTSYLEALAAGPLEDGEPPDAIFTKLSRLLHARTPPERYATALLAILEPTSGRLVYTNGGHNPALLLHNSGEVEQLEATGVPIGLLPNAEYTAAETQLEAGDTLIMYTDGIVEAVNAKDEEYGLERMVKVCVKNRKKDLEQLAKLMDEDLESFAKGIPFADDRTLVMARRLK